ncbi:hypothetical protein E2C01_093868 [Portunus trituberculatus]|uniref:Uncharacterized protein n=1 Tax=Portunus trituberculatus TaxID=210409 RepID=A0A5B7JVD5_PORTR|nr:hypothetical protein [Portunus trituberculatus]
MIKGSYLIPVNQTRRLERITGPISLSEEEAEEEKEEEEEMEDGEQTRN